MPSPIDLILRSGQRPRLEGRTTPMPVLQDVRMPERESGGPGKPHAARRGPAFAGTTE
jgi:hypothetical protein